MEEIVSGLNVSRETYDSLRFYETLARKWTRKINLVSPSTVSDLWRRHIVDSAQVFHVKQNPGAIWLDIGSGAGFPGLVCAVLAKELSPATEFHLIESDQRKCAFLRTVKRELGLKATIWAQRIEAVETINANVVSARALADLDTLLSFADHHMAESGVALFQKGETWEKEVEAAKEKWRFTLNPHKSKTSSNSTILEIGGIERV
ncbi:16S rRNA (guanine(527)-N(7))-methyltransferase RsmG [Pseudoprimorskyibacter insulae]|uniref:Ribosomal RNA small subunit methyltransferase G n=1 Tax=Pseudoprimorskyibacter insulae TaxID=1695997 RepID=A0A2R8AU88_9RHOB|nr:16S rRNA (guanine(527)-N(7))-methyltransferase RsmG [Pseudoprimorskyibacter insulae]SPF79449.1 Ribosomal RNA small subunit methyltransferase G [Pseudoprimorskyibacter insulae]